MTTAPTSVDLSAYTDATYQVWVSTPEGGRWAYRTDLIRAVARNWSDAWTAKPPADVPAGSTFLAVKATTTFEVI